MNMLSVYQTSKNNCIAPSGSYLPQQEQVGLLLLCSGARFPTNRTDVGNSNNGAMHRDADARRSSSSVVAWSFYPTRLSNPPADSNRVNTDIGRLSWRHVSVSTNTRGRASLDHLNQLGTSLDSGYLGSSSQTRGALFPNFLLLATLTNRLATFYLRSQFGFATF